MCNTIKDLNLVLDLDPSYHFNINKTENITFLTPLCMTTMHEVGTLCISKLDTSKKKKKSHKVF